MGQLTIYKTFSAMCVVCLCAAGCGGNSAGGSASGQKSSAESSATQSGSTAAAAPADPGAGMFAGSQPWTVDVSGVEKSERSDAIMAALSAAGGWGTDNKLNIDFSIPVFFADANTPHKQVTGTEDYCFGGNACDSVPAEMPVPDGAYIEGSSDLTCDPSGNTDSQGDCHLLVVDRDARKVYETYQATQDGDAIKTVAFFVWDLDKEYPENLRGDQCTSADAGGFPISAMTPTADEVAAGSIDHAIRFILPNDRMKADVYVHPASHAGGPKSTEADAPPYGVRLRLKPDFDDSGFTDAQKVVITALKKYGMLLADGGNVPLTFADDKTSQAKWADLGIDAQSFSALGSDQFEVVELGDEVPLTYDCVLNG